MIESLNLVVRMEFGSHLYGTQTPTSDRDYKSVYLPSSDDILLQRVKNSIGDNVKSESLRNTEKDIDDQAYSLQRYLYLLSEGQTVALDMLFAPKLITTSPLWEVIRTNKNLLLTKRSAAFVGYCRTQANKYGIKGSRVAASKTAMDYFSRVYSTSPQGYRLVEISEYLPALVKECGEEHSRLIEVETTPGKTEQFFECCNRKVSVGNTIKAAYEIFSKIYENYGQRAKLAQINEGIDWKALSHAVRVGNEAIELLTTSNITFPLVNRDHILNIKKGLIPYEQVANEIEELLIKVEKAETESSLPDSPDMDFINTIVKLAYKSVVLKESNIRGM
jgi:predicted nucleotidyltransferase